MIVSQRSTSARLNLCRASSRRLAIVVWIALTRAFFEAELQEFNGETDHVHLLVKYPPQVALSKLVNSLKGASSRRMKQLHHELIAPAYRSNALWSPSYFACSVGGAPLSVIRQYIEQQSRPL